MKETEFAIFNPTGSVSDDNKEQLKRYYMENNVLLDNDYLKNYMGMDHPTITGASVVSSPAPPKIDIGAILGSISYGANSPTPTTSQPAATTTATPSSSTQLMTGATLNGKAKHAINYFMSQGLTKEQAAGIVGNLHAESGLNTSITGDNGTSYGLAQWHGERWDRLKDFAMQHKSTPDSFQTQLEFLWNELQTTEYKALSELKQAKTSTEAARTFAHKFERMAKYNVQREQMANHFYKV